MAIASLGQRVGSGAIPFLTQQMILLSGWRTAAFGIGLLVWSLTLAPVGLWLRRQPQDLGLLPDGAQPVEENDVANQADSTPQLQPGERSYGLSQALRTRPFWVILGAFCLTNFVNTGINFNLIAHLTDSGLTDAQAATVLLVWALMSIPATLGSGLLAERFSARAMMMVLSTGVGAGILLFMLVNSFTSGLLFAVLHGASFGGAMLMLQLILADYYGSASLGTLRGFILPWQMVANAMGPLTATLVYDVADSYNMILTVYIGLEVALILVILLVLPNRHHWEARSKAP
jgi:sugar phosphate permease